MVKVTQDDLVRLMRELNASNTKDASGNMRLSVKTGISIDTLVEVTSVMANVRRTAAMLLLAGKAHDPDTALMQACVSSVLAAFELGWECRHQFGAHD